MSFSSVQNTICSLMLWVSLLCWNTDKIYLFVTVFDIVTLGTKKWLEAIKNEMLPWSIHWVACGTCYRKSEGTELCGIEIQHSSLWRITNKREARNIGFWADMLIIFKFPHNFFAPQVCPLSIWQLCNTKLHWSQALLSGVSVRMGDQNNKPLVKSRSIWPKILLTLTNANSARYRFC